MNILDIHTHNQLADNAIINLNDTSELSADKYYSIGIHPWLSDKYTQHQLSHISQIASYPQVLAIGECGLDAIKGDKLENQIKLLKFHIKLSEAVKKPLILHIVKCYPQIIALKKEYKPTQPWIIHGFRGKPQLAEELIRHGVYLSFGCKYNPSSVQITPIDRLLAETDDCPCSITQIIKNIADIKKIPTQTLEQNILDNAQKLFKSKN